MNIGTPETLALRKLLDEHRDGFQALPAQLLKRPISESALAEAVAL